MSAVATPTKKVQPRGEDLRFVPLGQIQVEEDFNPRQTFDAAAHKQLVASVRERGVLVPLRVRETGVGEGYVLIAGERRLRAARDAGLSQVAVIVAHHAEDDPAGALIEAVAENVARKDLGVLEQARAFGQLRDAGVPIAGIAAACSVSQRLVRERLQILGLTQDVQAQIAAGDVPLRAVGALLTLAAGHPDLPALAIEAVAGEQACDWLDWNDLIEDPAGVACDGVQEAGLPDGVAQTHTSYPAGQFTLTAKAAKDLAALAKLTGRDSQTMTVRFGMAEIEQATALKAFLPFSAAPGGLICGQHVADQLASDHITAQLKAQRAIIKQRKEQEAQETASADAAQPGGGEAPPSEVQRKAQIKAEREAIAEAQRKDRAFNQELAVAVMKAFIPSKLDQPTIALLAAVGVGEHLPGLAERGARYGYPGWFTQTTTKSTGRVTVTYLSGIELAQKAREHLDGATSAGQLAGRILGLLVMARLARQEHLPQSVRSAYRLPASSQIPGATGPVAVIEELAIDRLPEHLTHELRAERAARAKAQAEKDAASRRVRAQRERVSELTDSELDALLTDAHLAFGRWSTDTFQIERAVRAERKQRAEQSDPAEAIDADAETDAADAVGVGEGAPTGR